MHVKVFHRDERWQMEPKERILNRDSRITSRVDLAMSVRMIAEISETIGARLLRFCMQIPELLTQRKFV